jgi:hypothetical protein
VEKKRKPAKRSKRSADHTPVIITVTDAKLKTIQQVAQQLAAKGMKVKRVLPITGVISGSSPSSKMASLESVEGVASVEEELAAVLPPPDSQVQ